MRFTKAHGIGNDFIIVAETDVPAEWASWAIRLCDRNRGIGGDGVLIVGIDAPGNVARMKLLNPDGTHGEISGNGVRCVAAYAYSRGLLPESHTVAPPPGPRPVTVRRIVVPLMPAHAVPSPAGRLNPRFQIGDEAYLMVTQFMAAIPRAVLGRPVTNLADQDAEIMAALDMVLVGF